MSTVLRPVILSGGAGTRLWPLSTPRFPKQFLELVGTPLLVQALGRLDGAKGVGGPVVVTGMDHLDLLEQTMQAAQIAPYRVIAEPKGRNTAPAVIAAALCLDPDEIMVVLPADHLIDDRATFVARVQAAAELARDGALVTFGVTPTRVDTGYGYIEKGPPLGPGFEIASFTEKPEREAAQKMLKEGRHLWNSGIFMFTAGKILAEAQLHTPELVVSVGASLIDSDKMTIALDRSFADVSPVSLDEAIMEKTGVGVVLPIDVGWSDLGSWLSLWEVSEKDDNGNVLIGDVTVVDVAGAYVRSDGPRLAVAGIDDVIVVAADETVMVLGKGASQLVRRLAEGSEEQRG